MHVNETEMVPQQEGHPPSESSVEKKYHEYVCIANKG